MNRFDAIKSIIKHHGECAYIFSNGLTSREAAYFFPNENSFYLLHAMGEALSVGIGLANARPDLDVIVIDGDGNSMMGAASWFMYDEVKSNCYYYVLSNQVYDTTGGQPLPLANIWPNWVNIIEIVNDKNIVTPNPPGPEVILDKFTNWLKSKGEI